MPICVRVQVICDMVEHPTTGVLAILDEKCLMVGTQSDTDFLRQLDRQFAKHDHYSSRQVRNHYDTMFGPLRQPSGA